MGEAPVAYQVVLTKCWEDASLTDTETTGACQSATGRGTQGAAAEGNQGRQKYHGRLDPQDRTAESCGGGWVGE